MKKQAGIFVFLTVTALFLGGCVGGAGGNTNASLNHPVIEEPPRIAPVRYAYSDFQGVSYLTSEQFLLCRRKDLCPIEKEFTPSPSPLMVIKPPQVKPEERKLDLPLRAVVHFSSGSARLQPDALDPLDEFVRSLKRADLSSIRIVIAGYTDSMGSMEVNKELAKDRAEAVASHLRDMGIIPKEMMTGGNPLCCYIAPNSKAENRAKNRRAEIWVEPIMGAEYEKPR